MLAKNEIDQGLLCRPHYELLQISKRKTENLLQKSQEIEKKHPHKMANK